VEKKPVAIIPDSLSQEARQQLEGLGFGLREIPEEAGKAFVFEAAGMRSIIGLSESVAQVDVARLEDAAPMDKLQIFGSAGTREQAIQRRADLEILLQSGSLSVSVKSISKETISPLLGEDFLQNVLFTGIAALVVVALVLFLRYRMLKLTFPIMFIGLAEVLITVALASLISKFDLGAVAGILAAVGTGVDDQIIITDELRRGVRDESGSLVARAKRAFFMIIAAAATMLAAMLPIILVGSGLGRLVGFAITTTIGVLVGVLITRPAFGEIAKKLFEKSQ
jgi:preprotein translocase subunit SecD